MRAEFAAVVARREDEQLARDELIGALLGQLVGDVEQFVEIVAEQHFAARSLHRGQTVKRGREIGSKLRHIGAGFLEQRSSGAALLVEQCGHQVHRLDVLIVAADGQRLGIRKSGLELGRQLVHTHENYPSESIRMPPRWGYGLAIQRPACPSAAFSSQMSVACRPVVPSRR